MPWLLLGVAVSASFVIRAPLILNARSHIDSDLAVDGLAQLQASRGDWRWHYPGTPHIGTLPVLLGLPIAGLWGVIPVTLAVLGASIAAIGIVATYLLTLRVFGAAVGAWTLIPLTIASTGTIWLSGRVTGGHLLAAAWHAGAFLLAYESLARGGWKWTALFGVWCGLGLWNDSLFVMTMAGLVPACVMAWVLTGRRRGASRIAAVFLLGLLTGLVPKGLGTWSDPYDAYREQFSPVWRADVLLGHLKILRLDCLPRLISGHRLPGLEADPGGFTSEGQAILGGGGKSFIAWPVVILGMGLSFVGVAGLAAGGGEDPGRVRWAVRWGLLGSTGAVLIGFVVNRNIFNSDNYRYLVLFLVPSSVGAGRVLEWLARRGQGGAVAAGILGLTFAVSYTLDTLDWYRRLGWVQGWRLIVRTPDDPVLAWIEAHPEVDALYGGYWDVYRLAFLTGGRVKGIPSAHYPDRFPEWSRGLRVGHPGYALVRPSPVGLAIRQRVARDGGKVVHQSPGALILTWP